jgi:hypothetical protein
VNGAFEGDLVRPLGLVTLNFGYAEYELDSFLERLASAELLPSTWAQRPLGRKLALLTEAISTLDASVKARHDELLSQAQELLVRRNGLIHGCLLSGGRIVSGRAGVSEKRTSVEDLNALAEAISAWKERLWSYRWRQVEPLISHRSSHAPPNKSLERTRAR